MWTMLIMYHWKRRGDKSKQTHVQQYTKLKKESRFYSLCCVFCWLRHVWQFQSKQSCILIDFFSFDYLLYLLRALWIPPVFWKVSTLIASPTVSILLMMFLHIIFFTSRRGWPDLLHWLWLRFVEPWGERNVFFCVFVLNLSIQASCCAVTNSRFFFSRPINTYLCQGFFV